jgi:LacI family transcriptional regulator
MPKPRSHRPVTLKDIAGITGYSVNTVSRALRDMKDISAAAKKTIREISRKMGYINNAQASSLRLGHTNTIAVILGDISNPYFGIQMKAIEDRARSEGYSSFLLNTNENIDMEREAIQSALNKNVDGILICPTQQTDENIRYLLKTGIPFVQIGRYFEHLDASFVLQNDRLGGYQAVKYLIENGHRDILMLSGPAYISSAHDRLAGYRQALEEVGLPVKAGLIREIPITTEGCAGVLTAILREKLHFTAIFAFSDLIAWDVWVHLEQFGLNIPGDISLIGFDNIQSRLAIPFRLSTINPHKITISNFAVDYLVDIIHGKISHCRRVIDTQLITGETVQAFSTPEKKALNVKKRFDKPENIVVPLH